MVSPQALVSSNMKLLAQDRKSEEAGQLLPLRWAPGDLKDQVPQLVRELQQWRCWFRQSHWCSWWAPGDVNNRVSQHVGWLQQWQCVAKFADVWSRLVFGAQTTEAEIKHRENSHLVHTFMRHCTISPHLEAPSRITGLNCSIKCILVQLCLYWSYSFQLPNRCAWSSAQASHWALRWID